MPKLLDHIDTWIFDLDNTLYPSDCNLFELIDVRMGLYIQRLLDCDAVEARRVQKEYFINHGTTLSGLMASHNVSPDDFLDFVHDITFDRLDPNPALAKSLAALPGRKLIFTNGDATYAARVLDALGLGSSFEAIHDIRASGYVPKPHPDSYASLCAALNIVPQRALFAEDMARNLKPAKAIGMTTLWINNGSEYGGAEACASFIDYETDCASAWFANLTGTPTS
jgi:putative hydrolase of the HAD superfamily